MGTVKAVKSFGGKEETREFSETSWESGTPAKNGWRKVDMNTEVLARKLPEHAEILSKKVTEVVVPPMPQVKADDEVIADEATPAVELSAPEVAPEPPAVAPKQKAKPGPKKAK